MRILGIDPGLKLTGYGVIEWAGGEVPGRPPGLVDAGVIRLDAKAQMPARLLGGRKLDSGGTLLFPVDEKDLVPIVDRELTEEALKIAV